MRAALALLALVLVSCWASTGNAELPKWVDEIGLESPPPALLGEDTITYMRAGDKAPYEGMLLDMTTATRWTLRGEWAQRQLRVDADLLRLVMAQEIKYRDTVQRSNEASRQKEIEALRSALREQTSRLESAKNPPFYRTARFGVIIGVLTSVALASAVFALAN